MTKRVVLALIANLLFGTAAGWAKAVDANPTLRVAVSDQTRLNQDTLDRALGQVTWIFRRAGVSIEWTDSVKAAHKSLAPSFTLIVLERQLREIQDGGRLLLGLAPRDGTRSAKVAYVFMEPIEYLSDVHAVDAAMILAHAIAHELGHLLMPARLHAASGLMDGNWGGSEIRAATWGQQTFSDEEAALIRRALATDRAAVLARR
jgi:hypothetical protein